MPVQEVIDLSLSTDDEAASKRRPTASKTVKPTKKIASDTLLNNDHDFDFSPEISRLSKRRRLSPPIDNINRNVVDEIISTQDLAANKPLVPSKPRKRSDLMIDSDPILFTSSPIPQTVRTSVNAAITTHTTTVSTTKFPPRVSSPIGGFSDDDFISLGSENDDTRSITSEFDIAALSTTIKAVGTNKTSKSKDIPKSTLPPRTKPPSKPRTATTSSSAAEKERLKAERAAARLAASEAKAIAKVEAAARKKAEREEKAREKQHAADLAEANKARHEKRVSAPEMIVDLPISIQGKSVETILKEQLKSLKIETSTYTSLLPNVIKWRRKVNVRWDEEAGHWLPLRPTRIEEEAHVLVLVSAQEFVAMSDPAASEDERLEAHVARLKSKFRDAKIIYLIEGLEPFLRKSKNAMNREYQAAVRAQGQADSAGGKKSKAKETAVVDEAAVEDGLLRLQVVHECLVHHTAKDGESAEWIVHFTQHISTIPYKTVRNNISTSFCMDVGQVPTGEDAADTYIKMLQQVVRVTAPIAYGIAARYPDVLSLMDAFERKGPTMLEDLKKSANKSGGFSEARIGPAISRRLEKVFLGRDPNSMDI